MRRQALVVGIEGPATDPADDSPPRWQQLTYAAPYAQRVGEVLEKQYAYVLLESGRNPAATATALGDALTQAVRSEADFIVIHLLAHGEPTRNGHGIQAVGGDGRLTETLARWVDMAENRDTDGSGDPAVLLILDLCHSGAVVTEHLRSLVRPERRRVWVLAACHSEQDAYDGRLSTAVDEVLRGFASGALKLDTSVPYIPIARFCREVALHVESRSTALNPQSVEQPLAALGADLSHLKFFSNPGYVPAGARRLTGVDPAVFTLLDEVADARHFVIRAHGADSAFGDLGAPSFTGRSGELQELAGWLDGHGASMRVVTGVPGVGKSALIGTFVCAAHPLLHEATEQLWRPSGGDIPQATDGLAIVHARRRGVSEILTSLAAQWELGSPGHATMWTTDQLVTALRAKPVPPCLVMDAVDEAEHPADLVSAVLLPLASIRRSDGAPLCRMLVAARPEAALRPLIEAARAHDGLIDLDGVSPLQLRKDLAQFVLRVLRPLNPGGTPWCSLAAAESLGSTLADTLVNGSRDWGEFLVAGLYLRLLQEQMTPPETAEQAVLLGSDVPRTLDAVLDLHLRLDPRPGLHELLAALAWAEGAGMPEDLLAHIMKSDPVPAEKDRATTTELLRAARFYIRRNVDREGAPLYRLFHQGLADRLRERPVLDAAIVWERLLTTVHVSGSGRRRWATAEPYLLRYAARHSALAGKLDELLEDGEFLVHADPAPLAEELYHGKHGPHGTVYLTSYGAHHDGPPDQRRDILAVDAARHQQWQLAADLTQDTGRHILWTAGRALHTGLLTTLTGHRGKIWDLTTLVMHGRPHALTAGQDGTARLWDLDSATTTVELGDHGAPVGGVVAGKVRGRHVAVTGCDSGELLGWDLATGRLLWRTPAHEGPIWSMVGVQYEGASAVASAGEDRVIRYWEIATGAPLATTKLSAVNGNVWQLSRVTVDGRGDCVVACYDDWVKVLTVHGEEVELPHTNQERLSCYRYLDLGHGPEPVAGDQDGTVWIGDEFMELLNEDRLHADAVTDLAAVLLDGSMYILSAGTDGVAQLNPLDGDGSTRQVVSHTTAITRVAIVSEPHRTRILTASNGGTVRVSDAAGHEIPQRHPGHAHAINALTVLSDGRLVSCSEDGSIALWTVEGVIGQRINLLYHSDFPLPDRATGIAVLEAGEHPRIVASCAHNGVALWDTNTTEKHLERRDLGEGPGASAIVTLTIRGAQHVIYASDRDGVKIATADHLDRMTRWPNVDVTDPAWAGEPERVLLAPSEARAVEEWGVTVPVTAPATCLAASATHVLAGYRSGHVQSAHLLGPPLPRLVAQHPVAVHAVATVDIDGQTYAVSGDDRGEVRVTALDATRTFTLAGHARAVFAATPVLLDGDPYLFTGGLDRSLRLWDLRSGSQVDVFWFPDTVCAIAVAPDGALYIGVGPDVIHMAPHDRLPVLPYPTPDQGTCIR
ncbi:WD40 repeat domain-containing protein [Streptomyces sp. NPDC006544]|uniref:WD40 repeat domain-containing protein n=1 Tax=Streptomyces sp. NPDC006544 TaxID=3154583 RepID=UPI0033A90622